MVEVANADAAHRLLVSLPRAPGLLTREGGDDELATADEPRELTKDELSVGLVFVAADDQEAPFRANARVTGTDRPLLELTDSTVFAVSVVRSVARAAGVPLSVLRGGWHVMVGMRSTCLTVTSGPAGRIAPAVTAVRGSFGL